MRKLSLVVLCLLAVSSVWAGIDPTYLPSSTHYQGRNSFYVNDGNGSILQGHLEFAVYDTQEQTISGYDGDARYIYAYQIFSYSSSTAALTYFSLAGFDTSLVSSTVLGSDDSLGGAVSGGVSPTSNGFQESDTKAVWEFSDGKLVKLERSWFLLLYSDHDYKTGSYQVKATFNDDVPTPTTPEPATVALLAVGSILSMRRKRQ
jgi:hypothetical protein